MKLLTKTIITTILTSAFAQGLSAKTSICYKNNWTSPSTIETVALDGGVCQGKFSYKQMQKKGWSLRDIRITKGEKGLNYSYILTDEKLVDIDNSEFMENKFTKLDYKPIVTRIQNVDSNTATINVGNLRIGQSAVVQHNFENGQRMLVANAYVTSSNSKSSQLKLLPFLDLKQNALPTSNRKAIEGDIAVVNYMYDSSLIVAPSRDAFIATREKYKDNNFLHSDLFASRLKAEGEPLPSKEIIQDYAISQNLGTIFFIIDSLVYVVDTKTFAILQKDTISYNFIENKQMPFYTRVEKIEKNFFKNLLDFDGWLGFVNSFLGDDKRSEEEILLEDEVDSGELVINGEIYNNYYKAILGIK